MLKDVDAIVLVGSKEGRMLKDVYAMVLGRVYGRKDAEGCGCSCAG